MASLIPLTGVEVVPETTLSLPGKAALAVKGFQDRFHAPPRWCVAAPGRVNLIGEHVDYCDGLVMPMAIERHVVLVAAPGERGRMRVFSGLAKDGVEVPLGGVQVRGEPVWANYIRGVVEGYHRLGAEIPGLDVWVESDLPMGGGLSSSAALEVATATLLGEVTGLQLGRVEKALLCQRAEHEFAGVPCGLMDQLASIHGQEGCLMRIDCRSREVCQVPLGGSDVSVLVINTRVHHELGSSEYGRRRAECEAAVGRLGVVSLRDARMEDLEAACGDWPDVLVRRARHVIGEIERVRQASVSLVAADWEATGEFLYQSHESLRADFEVSCAELDLVVRLARGLGRDGGVFGCRMTGGGFGGCCVALVDSSRADEVGRKIGTAYLAATGIEPGVFVSRPAAGAQVLAAGAGGAS